MAATTTPEAQEILDRALKLPETDRAAIGHVLLDSVHPPPNSYESAEELRAELQRRMDAIENGTMKTYSIEETMAYLRQECAERNGR